MATQTDASKSNGLVYHESGRFGGWPANAGIWQWEDEIVVGFEQAYFKASDKSHSKNREKPSRSVLARSLDGGETWNIETPSDLPRHDGFRWTMEDMDSPLPTPEIDFTHPDFAMRCGGNLFLTSYDRCKTWSGPYELPTVGDRLTARTDYIVNSASDCHVFISTLAPRIAAGLTDRAVCVRTIDGGKSFTSVSWITAEDDKARSVMSATVRCSETTLVTALRRRIDTQPDDCEIDDQNWIDVYRSTDDGATWEFLSKVAETAPGAGHNGNPPAIVRLDDGRLCVAYGYRAQPYGIRAKISGDEGATWGDEIVLRDDGRTWDLGYPRMIQRPDGKLLTIYYYTTTENPEQHIASTIWDPDTIA
jgi:hypothetical protein